MTMVFEKKDCIPLICTANQSTVGIRYPSHKVAHRLIELSGPIAAPSANLFGHISPVKAQHVQDDFPELTVLNGDQADIGIESTVLQIRKNEVFVFRKGFITVEKIRQILEDNGLGNVAVNYNKVS